MPLPVTPGPMFSFDRAEQLARETGEDFDYCIRYLEGKAEGKKYSRVADDIHVREPGARHIDILRSLRKIANVDRELDVEDAIAAGTYWDIAIGLMPGKALVLICNGKHGDSVEDDMLRFNREVYGIVRSNFIGDRRDARAEAARLSNLDEIIIRFVVAA